MGRKPVESGKRDSWLMNLPNLVHGEEEAKKAQDSAKALICRRKRC